MHIRIHRRHHATRRPKLRRSHTMVSHLGRVHQELRRRVLLVMLRHDGVLRVRSSLVMARLVKPLGNGPLMLDGGLVLLRVRMLLMLGRRRVKGVLLLALFSRMRVLARVVDMIVSDPVVSRQRGFETWIPPERTALDGCRGLGRKNLMGGPLGLGWRVLEVPERRRGGVMCGSRGPLLWEGWERYK